MAFISKQSLEELKTKIDLVEVISSFMKLTKSGSHYKGLCPFHNEKSPSFSISLGDKHYHCFGCGAHGDAIAFLMEYSKLSFSEALSYLAEKYQITLEHEKEDDLQRVSKGKMKEALCLAEDFYHFCLLHTHEGEKAAYYAKTRHLDKEFIERFKLGYSPKNGALTKFLKSQGVDQKTLIDAGLLHGEKKTDFFFDRFMIPIHDATGCCIGFSARKLDKEGFGGKYINTQETALFKKSHVLFGLKFSRARIIKEKKALICEGQIDAMRLIHEGYDWTVASQGTAFGQAHVQMLKKLGVTLVYLAFDGDHAGKQAAIKVGEYFMQEQVSVHVIELPASQDPDAFLLANGKKAFDELIAASKEYVDFLYNTLKSSFDLSEPSEKNRFVAELKSRITEFKDPVLIYESLKKLAHLAEVPERLLGIYQPKLARPAKTQSLNIDKNYVLDLDVIRFYYLAKLQKLPLTQLFIDNPLNFSSEKTQKLFEAISATSELEMMPFMAQLDPQLHPLLESLFEKKVNRLKIQEGAKEAIYKLLERDWLKKREQLKEAIKQAENEQAEQQLSLQLNQLLKTPPRLEGSC